MSLRALSIALTVLQAVVANEINIDWPMLTDFTTNFISYPDRVMGMLDEAGVPQVVASASAHGTIQADVFNERLKIVQHTNYALKSGGGPLPPLVQGMRGTEFFQFTFDAPKGFVSMRLRENVNSRVGPGAFEFCTKVNFPQGLLPPGAMLKSRLEQREPQIQSQVNGVPHMDVTLDGESIAVVRSTQVHVGPRRVPVSVYAGLRHNGAPFGVGIVPPSGGQWKPFVKFTSWTHGAGEIPEIPCIQSASELIAHPDSAKAFEALDHLMTTVKGAESMEQMFAVFPEQPSLIFRSAAELEAAANGMSAIDLGMNIDRQPATSWSMLVVAGVAGVLGSVVVIASFLVMSKASARSLRRESLISDDA